MIYRILSLGALEKKLFKKKIAGGFLVIVALFVLSVFWFVGKNNWNDKLETEVVVQGEEASNLDSKPFDGPKTEEFFREGQVEPIPVPLMEKMKKKGCIVDGVLNGHGGEDLKDTIRMINDSECYYLHRSIETWLEAPDFEEIKENMEKIEKEDVVFGMFIAEAIDKKADYDYPALDREFDFSQMCRRGSDNFWGEHTCKPSFERSEYRRYVLYITERAMDLGVQSFMFGQVFYQDSRSEDGPYVKQVIKEMREYADFKGMKIMIGAQTNDIDDPDYLQIFDFIEGGVGLGADGEIEGGPCFSRWWKKEGDWCWALLWHERFKKRAKNVLVHLDWSGKSGDDMSTFARMSERKRHDVLAELHKHFTSQDVGFLMPMQAVLPKDNGGCHGESRKFYSASKKYSCDDEKVINKILKKGE